MNLDFVFAIKSKRVKLNRKLRSQQMKLNMKFRRSAFKYRLENNICFQHGIQDKNIVNLIVLSHIEQTTSSSAENFAGCALCVTFYFRKSEREIMRKLFHYVSRISRA